MLGDSLIVSVSPCARTELSDLDSLRFHLVEDETLSDFLPLRNLLLKNNLHDLCQRTHVIHYENYRMKKFTSSVFSKTGKSFSNELVNRSANDCLSLALSHCMSLVPGISSLNWTTDRKSVV